MKAIIILTVTILLADNMQAIKANDLFGSIDDTVVPYPSIVNDTMRPDPALSKFRGSEETLCQGQNYPNPFNSTTTIKYILPGESRVGITVYNIVGRRVRTLETGRRAPGEYTVIWDGTDESGNVLASGVYFYLVMIDNHATLHKMVMVK